MLHYRSLGMRSCTATAERLVRVCKNAESRVVLAADPSLTLSVSQSHTGSFSICEQSQHCGKELLLFSSSSLLFSHFFSPPHYNHVCQLWWNATLCNFDPPPLTSYTNTSLLMVTVYVCDKCNVFACMSLFAGRWLKTSWETERGCVFFFLLHVLVQTSLRGIYIKPSKAETKPTHILYETINWRADIQL